ncbi:MAG: diguanylate cyclase [Rhodospirillum sp.]|nr:diguanylate cyclase [Rhodospirillum sp.]MCF8488968.1 diguanylate cyclase [Rhodospirillum sp.]MCF8500009.1 diguanylate cyclase [Rhodospirillum sp.]
MDDLVDTFGPEGPQGKILIVEDSQFFMHVLKRRVGQDLGFEVIAAETMAEAEAAIEAHGSELFLCLIDLILPDAPNGEIVDLMTGHKLPTVVFTGAFSEDLREQVLSHNVIDYVTKDSPASLEYLVSMVRRLCMNARLKAIVVDDSKTARAYIRDLLLLYRFQVLEATNGEEALDLLKEHPDARLVVTDYYMPKVDGFELTKRIRKTHTRGQLAVIGVSTGGSAPLSARFIKYGANDFINKPFLREEFFCRIAQNMDNLDYINALSRAAQLDPLTGLHNRRFLFEAAGKSLAATLRAGGRPAVAVVDLDNFKVINDTHGHDVGDQVLVALADVLRETIKRKSDIVARFGGEEFNIFTPDLHPDLAFTFFDGIRAAVEANRVDIPDVGPIQVTCSIGVTVQPDEDLRIMIQRADVLLYRAKEAGRNRVAVDSPVGSERITNPTNDPASPMTAAGEV